MPLREYARKRDFTRTPEPRGRPHATPNGAGAFVIQKHAASRLHWDFRLELDGVLKSWAVPKGPSLDPADKRLAMHVEDHPVEYGDFEGVIPKGEYGGGTVMLWDRGTWTPVGDPHEGYRKGSLKFTLDGERLHGGWALVRMRGRGERDDDRTWLLIKEKDAAARAGWDAARIEGKAKSVASDRTMYQIAAAQDRVWHSKDAPWEGPSTPPAAKARGARAKPAGPASPRRAAALPRFVPPELATLVSEAPEGDDWVHEIKFDGYRILARLEDGRARLMSRNDKDWTARFPDVAGAVARLSARRALIDGEVVVLMPDGTSSFQGLQNLLNGERRGELVYMVFDLLHLDGRDLTTLPLEERKAALRALVVERAAGVVRYSAHVVGGGVEFLRQACRLRLEGAVAKRRDAPYRSGRGRDWLKVKCGRRQEVVIGGFTRGEGSRVGLGALLVGVHEGPRLVFAGKVGTGFDAKSLRALTARLAKLERRDSPFDPAPRMPGARWVKPELVAEVAFTEWTSDGKMRHPSFQGLREDKPAADVTREVETGASVARRRGAAEDASPARAGTRVRGARRSRRAPAASASAPALAGDGPTVGGVRLTHPDRVFFPNPRITKLDLARYYESIAEWILPHLAGRPTTLVRCPDGIDGQCFYQRHAGPGAAGGALRRVKVSGHKGDALVVDSLAGLISVVQLGILEIHTWNATTDELERPDRIVLDLDPGPGVTWRRVIEAARLVHRMLERVGLESFVKTSGGKGLHVVAPLSPGATWDETGAFTRAVAETLARHQPDRFTATMAKAARPGKIYVDYLRNRRAATTVAAYSTRARAGAPVSMPVAWDEISPRVTAERFTVETVPARLAARRADPWIGYLKVRQRLPAGSVEDAAVSR
jgi:bifunctional non-homologous end joining protein LigD